MNKAQRDIRRKTRVLEHAARIGNVRKTCRYFGVARSGFYVWKKAYGGPGQPEAVARTTHGSAHPPTSSRRSSISAARITPRPHPHRLGSRALSRHHDFESRGPPHPPPPRPALPPVASGDERCTTHRYATQVPWAPRDPDRTASSNSSASVSISSSTRGRRRGGGDSTPAAGRTVRDFFMFQQSVGHPPCYEDASGERVVIAMRL